jgi:ComF family protein
MIVGLVDWIFPRFCAVCRNRSEAAVCRGCEPSLEWIRGPRCLRCGAGAPTGRSPCRECIGKEFQFDGATALGWHSESFRGLVLKMKHPDHGELADYFAIRLAERLRSIPTDLVAPIPMTRSEFWWGGYNSSVELAEHVARRLRLPFHEHLLKKTRTTQKQKELPLNLRTKNLVGAFDLDELAFAPGAAILLVDDVLTTGATLSACAAPLKAAGAARVWAAVVTRG